MKRTLLVASALVFSAVVAGWWISWENDTDVRRGELLAIRAAITPGMSREEVVGVIRKHVRRTLFRNDNDKLPLLCVQEADYLGAWILSIRFNSGRAAAVHIGDYDDIYKAPRGAPPALVWGTAER